MEILEKQGKSYEIEIWENLVFLVPRGEEGAGKGN